MNQGAGKPQMVFNGERMEATTPAPTSRADQGKLYWDKDRKEWVAQKGVISAGSSLRPAVSLGSGFA